MPYMPVSRVKSLCPAISRPRSYVSERLNRAGNDFISRAKAFLTSCSVLLRKGAKTTKRVFRSAKLPGAENRFPLINKSPRRNADRRWRLRNCFTKTKNTG